MGAYDKNYLSDSTELMRLLFEEVAKIENINFEFFVSSFMNSNYRRLMDDGSTRLINMTYDELLSYLIKDETIIFKKDNKINIDYLQAGWIGSMYNIIQFKTKMSSSEIYNTLNLDRMMSYFVSLHTIDEELAVDKIINGSLNGKK